MIASPDVALRFALPHDGSFSREENLSLTCPIVPLLDLVGDRFAHLPLPDKNDRSPRLRGSSHLRTDHRIIGLSAPLAGSALSH